MRPTIGGDAAGRRRTPRRLDERLHLVTLIIANFRATDDNRSIKAWFISARLEVGDLTPADVLQGEW